MTVDSTEKGVAFYRNLFGLDVGVATHNPGTTEEVLGNPFNDSCLVTEMRPASSPSYIEFLDYGTPPDGRPMPADSKANDFWHCQATLVTGDLQAVTDRLREAAYSLSAGRGDNSAGGVGSTRLQESSDGP
jgi:hypothetical protein